MLDPFTRDDEGIPSRPIIPLESPHAVPQWWIALWIASILSLGTVGAVAFAMPDIIDRVNVAEGSQ